MHISTLLLGLLPSPVTSQAGLTAPAWTNANRNESGIYGYQLLGSGFVNDLTAACDNVTTLDRRRWIYVYLDTTYISKAFCDQIGWTQDYDIISQNVKFYNTGLFLTWLLNAFDTSVFLPNATNPTTANTRDSNPFIYLCGALQANLLEAFSIDSSRVLSAVCAASNQTLSPPPISNTTYPSPEVLFDNMQIRSNLLGYVLLATSGTYAASDELCDRGNDFIVPLIKQGLDGHNMSNLLCGREGRRQGIMEVVDMMMELRTKLFVNIIENVSDRTGWMGWLCDNLAAEALSVPGLYGSRATGAVCWDASPSEGLWGYCGKGPLDSECNEVVDGTGLVRKT